MKNHKLFRNLALGAMLPTLGYIRLCEDPPAPAAPAADPPAPAPAAPAAPANPPAPATPPADPAATAPITLTQAELDARMATAASEALAAKTKADEAAANAAKIKAARAKATTDNDQGALLEVEQAEHQNTRTALNDAQNKVVSLTRELAVTKAANAHSLAPVMVGLMMGDTTIVDEVTANAKAKELAKFKQPIAAPNNDANNRGNRPAPRAANPAPADADPAAPRNPAPAAPAPGTHAFSPAGGVAWPD